MEGECFDIQKVEAFLSFYTIMGEGQFCQLSTHLHTILVSAAKYINVCIATLHLYRKYKTHLDCDSIQNEI